MKKIISIMLISLLILPIFGVGEGKNVAALENKMETAKSITYYGGENASGANEITENTIFEFNKAYLMKVVYEDVSLEAGEKIVITSPKYMDFAGKFISQFEGKPIKDSSDPNVIIGTVSFSSDKKEMTITISTDKSFNLKLDSLISLNKKEVLDAYNKEGDLIPGKNFDFTIENALHPNITYKVKVNYPNISKDKLKKTMGTYNVDKREVLYNILFNPSGILVKNGDIENVIYLYDAPQKGLYWDGNLQVKKINPINQEEEVILNIEDEKIIENNGLDFEIYRIEYSLNGEGNPEFENKKIEIEGFNQGSFTSLKELKLPKDMKKIDDKTKNPSGFFIKIKNNTNTNYRFIYSNKLAEDIEVTGDKLILKNFAGFYGQQIPNCKGENNCIPIEYDELDVNSKAEIYDGDLTGDINKDSRNLRVKKVDENENPLEGGEFTVIYKDTKEIVKTKEDILLDNLYSNKEGDLAIKIGDDEKLLRNLKVEKDREYQLIEKKPPEGYDKPEGVIDLDVFELDDETDKHNQVVNKKNKDRYLTIEKKWEGKREDRVTIDIYKDGSLYRTIYLDDESWVKRTLVDSEGDYTIRERGAKDDQIEINGNTYLVAIVEKEDNFTVTNSYRKPSAKDRYLTIEKKWEGKREDRVTIDIYKDGSLYRTIYLDDESWVKRTLVDSEGDYTIRERGAKDDQIEINGNTYLVTIVEKEDNFTVTNSYRKPSAKDRYLTIEKKWEGKKEDRVTIDIYKDGSLYRTLYLDDESWVKRTLVDSEGDYTIRERGAKDDQIEINGNTYLVTIVEKEDNFTVTNSYRRPSAKDRYLTIEKKWEGKKEDRVTIDIYKDGSLYRTIYLDDESWVKRTLVDSEGDYTIRERGAKDDQIEINGNTYLVTIVEKEDNFTVTNSYRRPSAKDRYLTIEKKWEGKKEDRVTIDIYKDGSLYRTIYLDDESWVKRTLVDSEGDYTIRERGVKDDQIEINGNTYLVTIVEKEDEFLVINSYENNLKTIKIEKEWIGSKEDKVDLILYGNEEKIGEIELSEDNSWTYEFTDLPRYDGGDENKKIIYTIKEVGEKEGYISFGNRIYKVDVEVGEDRIKVRNSLVEENEAIPPIIRPLEPGDNAATGDLYQGSIYLGIMVLGLFLLGLVGEKKKR